MASWPLGQAIKVLPTLDGPYNFVLTTEYKISSALDNRSSKWKWISNGLPQGMVLAPTLYINDLPPITSWKFAYADNICCATQAADLRKQGILDWRYINTEWLLYKMTTSAQFCKNSFDGASHELDVRLNGSKGQHDYNPVYFGVTLDCSLIYCKHLEKRCKSECLKQYNFKIGRIILGCQSVYTQNISLDTLLLNSRGLGPNLVSKCTHTHLINRSLNSTMRTILGTISSTPVPWLKVGCHIVP